MKPPVAEKRPVTTSHHNIARTDNYAWLRAENWQAVMRDPSVLAPDIRAYLEAENAYAAHEMADVEGLRLALFKEMRGRIKEDDSSVPSPDGAYAYSTRYEHGAEHPMVLRSRRDGSDPHVMLDANRMAAGKANFRLGGFSHSPDHKLVAYATDEKGHEYFTLHLRNAETGQDLVDKIEETSGGAVWANDGRTLFYVWIDANHRPAKVFRHVVGTDPADDVAVYEEADPGFFISVGKTQSRKFIVIDTHDHETSEVRIIDADDPAAAPRLIAPRQVGLEYSLGHNGDRFYLLTNTDGAEDFKIMTAPLATSNRSDWRDLIPHQPGRLILDFTVYRDHLVRLERESSLPRIVIRHLQSGVEHAIAFDEEAYSLGTMDGFEFDTTTLRFTYSSMTTPARIYDYDMATRTRVLLKEEEVPSGHNPDDYVTRRVFAPAEDGETVPISLLFRKGTQLDGSAPLLLYGYGAYGISIPAAFGITRLSLVDRGFVYAIAHIRGGKDKGYRWYADGRRENKVNTFTDFIAAARYLIDAKFTSKGRIVGWGGSAGGLLIGAVANMAPELFAGLIAEVPFVDTLNTMLDATLPLTPPEWPEWGNPIESADDYQRIAAYSPYDNVRAQAYPAILALAGLSDPRVTYWEPAKWVAKLRATKTDAKQIVFRTNMDAGHAGASGRFDRLHETAFATAFALKAVGVT
ncbi:MAG TPA: S9 family peptidase [Bauldia sp.]|nr:S9 family peptidase [Bauldia sp.]